MSNRNKRRNTFLAAMIVAIGAIMLTEYGLPKWHLPKWHFSKWHFPDMSSVGGWFASVPSWVWAIVGLLVVVAIVYFKKHGRPHISIPSIPGLNGSKYAPKGSLRPNWRVEDGVHKIVWGNPMDNGIAAVCPKTGDLYIAGGDGHAPDGNYHRTAIVRCPRGKDPRNHNNYETFWHGDGKCYGLTVLDNGDVVGFISDKGSMWDGAKDWRIRNFSNGKKSDHIDDWFGYDRAGQFAFMSGKVDGTAHVYFLRAFREAFKEFGGTVIHTSISRSKLERPDKINKHDFSKTSKVEGFVSPRRGSGTGWPYAVMVDVFRDGKSKILGALGDFPTAHIYRFKAKKPTGKFDRVSGHTGFGGIPRHGYHQGGENYTAGVFTQSLFYFNNEYWVSMSGSQSSDGIYIAKVK